MRKPESVSGQLTQASPVKLRQSIKQMFRPVAPEFCQRTVNPPVVIAGFRSISRDLAIEEFRYVFARYLGPGPLVDHGVSNVLQRNKRSLGISDIRLDA